MGLNVPKWIVIPQEVIAAAIPTALQNAWLKGDEQAQKEMLSIIDGYEFDAASLKAITNYFAPNAFFAVRSSAIDEDGNEFSFAGQFESYLYVAANDLAAHIKKVWCSAFSERVKHYRKNNGIEMQLGIAVIIQEMISAEVAGVGFGLNPTNGNRKEKVISAVYGLGEGLVSGELDADTFIIRGEEIESQLAEKNRQLVMNHRGGTRFIPVLKERQLLPSLSANEVKAISHILDQCFLEFGKYQDIEFAIANGEIYLLQARPITNINKMPDQSGEYVLWDNSNIIESYPGVTTPLTFSFISESYEGAYKLFSEYMGVSKKVIAQNENVFANTLGLMNGRVYYNLKTWYHMLAMLPGYSLNARFMEKMMGVKEQFDIPKSYQLSKAAAWWQIIKMAIKMTWNFFSLPKKRKSFKQLLDNTITEYQAINYSTKNANELMNLYVNFENKLLNRWKAPLLNDFFAMIWFGLLEKRCKQYLKSDNPNIHNDLLCGSSDIISTQPIHRSMALASTISNEEELKALFTENDEEKIWKALSLNNSPTYTNLKQDINAYLKDFGERCIGELKLETISYTQDPTQFIKTLKAYVETGITTEISTNNIEEKLRSEAEAVINKQLKFNPFKKWRLKRTLRYARQMVSERENLRYERTRAFGIVRKIFTQIGKQFYAENSIEEARDIFYLTKVEIFAFIEGRSVTQNLKALIALRKEEFKTYEKQGVTSERFATHGAVYQANDFFSTQKVEAIEGDLKGVGCCPGRVRGKVQVITDPREVSSLNGDILVTSSTDPGWVTLFPSASAIIVERGSLLSHSAIVSREMGKPCIVSVTGLMKTLKTGDEIEMDGSTGEIKILTADD